MTRDKSKFSSFKLKVNVTFVNNKKKKAKGIGDVHNTSKIENVLFIDGFKFNLLNTSQLCDKGNQVIF